MQEMNAVSAVPTIETNTPAQVDSEKTDVVSTHVLVAEDQFEKLKELSRRTRIAQSEYLREAVDDLLEKYKNKAG
ncbi:MAG: ribbon-helix-helix domain-containing protein [Myxococcaceae bacterium]|nr:ribbon-helix-helix domain-containing protein [Myxococcaceae bacterium]